jgi:hypothetical protein
LTSAALVSAAGGLPLGSMVKAIADDNQPAPRGQAQATLFVQDMSRRVERELGTLFPVPETPAGMLASSVTSNVQEVFSYFTQRKGKRELPLQ